MPLYEYDCSKCNHQVEVLVRNSEEKPECPECGGHELVRLMSATAAPNMNGSKSLPTARPDCGAPRCCGGGCDI
ncbi:FmdB family zinc ribbon protein [Roseiconus lacunae]|uniref:Zinc ribbon domain-containing protein n=1 Tax=Roseiconus lacunae TaxID=2605694 RepID=A0ABT7PBW3_9BACT|nr:zinc ribbon domain-containing protein [Roseiconus lacunae]MCD0463571.1 zinc ribbon domain-containing protein [Roseiconus lacunae]MDM4013980.1 zinc ribbon domain-containing protein [Roseiconus lacunae]WRQ53275.1 zinc ribbon domain-containing protein [Stieleria sp. HD01]